MDFTMEAPVIPASVQEKVSFNDLIDYYDHVSMVKMESRNLSMRIEAAVAHQVALTETPRGE